jgi:tellurite resistance protein
VAADRRILDVGLAHLYARAVLAIARAGGEIEPEEGLRLVERLEARSGRPVSLDDLLLAEPLDPAEVHAELAQLRTSASPFRGADLHPSELAEMIVTDGVAVALAKGHVSEEEARELLRFGVALGCSVDDLRGMSEHLAPFLAALDESIAFTAPAPPPAAAAKRDRPAKRKPGGAQGT